MKIDVAPDRPVYLVKGDDDVLLEDAVVELVHLLVGGADRSLTVEELDASRYDVDGEVGIGPIVDAAQTPPFLTDRRVVVARHAGMFSTKEAVAPLVEVLRDPLPGNAVVLVWEKAPRSSTRLGAVPKSLADVIKASGGVVVETSAGRGKNLTAWLDDHLRDAQVRLDASARARIVETIGDDVGRLVNLLPTLAAVYGPGAKVNAEDLTPYLGEQGGVQPWDLTDAIDRGDTTTAIAMLHRLMDGAGQHPLQIMAVLTNHYVRMLALDGADAADERAAAELLGIKGSTFPARKALDQSRRLGSDRLADFIGLLAHADVDLKGAKAWPPELVMEVLVARLASRSPKPTRGRSAAKR